MGMGIVFGDAEVVADYLAPSNGKMRAGGLERSMPFVFPIFFAVMWAAVCWVLAQMGWATLARQFRASTPGTTATTLTGGRVNSVKYGGCLRVGATDDGLMLSVLLPWRFGHPDLFIPFRHVRVSTDKSWFTHYVVFDVRCEDGSAVRIEVHRPSLTRLFKGRSPPEPLRQALA